MRFMLAILYSLSFLLGIQSENASTDYRLRIPSADTFIAALHLEQSAR